MLNANSSKFKDIEFTDEPVDGTIARADPVDIRPSYLSSKFRSPNLEAHPIVDLELEEYDDNEEEDDDVATTKIFLGYTMRHITTKKVDEIIEE